MLTLKTNLRKLACCFPLLCFRMAKIIVTNFISKNRTYNLVYQIYLSFQDPHHAAGNDQKVVPFNQVQFIKEAPENIKLEQENLEKWAQGDIKDDGKNGSPSTKEIDQQDTKKEKNNRPKDCIGKRAFLPEKEICGTVKFLGNPAGGGKLLYGIETVTSSVFLYGYNLGKDISRFLIVMSFC